MLTLPAGWLPLVSLSMVTLLRLVLPELKIDTFPDRPCVVPTSIRISWPKVCIVTCLLVMLDKSFI